MACPQKDKVENKRKHMNNLKQFFKEKKTETLGSRDHFKSILNTFNIPVLKPAQKSPSNFLSSYSKYIFTGAGVFAFLLIFVLTKKPETGEVTIVQEFSQPQAVTFQAKMATLQADVSAPTPEKTNLLNTLDSVNSFDEVHYDQI